MSRSRKGPRHAPLAAGGSLAALAALSIATAVPLTAGETGQTPPAGDKPRALGPPWIQTAAVGGGDPATVPHHPRRFTGIGQAADPALIAAWDIDVRPDGQGLPPGKGSAIEGEEIYAMQCASCHGDFGYGISGYPALVGGQAADLDIQPIQGGPEKTVGSYWPYASTLWDYIHRAMPFGNAESLTPDQVYALTAYILTMNGIIDEDMELTQNTLASVPMPNADGFYDDPRPDVVGTLCMADCRDSPPEITSNAKKIAVTPEGEDAVR